MSDFDKEAERERLREKYEQDKQKREASERMSDLLLKGATMTNAHCNDCGDPIFRYDGDEFCPTCQRVVTDDEAVEEAAEGEGQVDEPVETPDESDDPAPTEADGTTDRSPAAENGDTPDHIEVKQPDGPAVRTGDEPGVEESTAEGSTEGGDSGADQSEPAQRQPARRQPTGSPDQSARSRSPSGQSRERPGQSRERPPEAPSTSEPVGSAAAAGSGDDFGGARASLVRTLRKHAERAENADDPRRARDHLAAAREAAEALDALSGSY